MNTQQLFRWIPVSLLPAACLLTISAGSGFGLDSQSPSAVYNGVWKGQYKGRVFVVLTLSSDDRGSVKGKIAIGDIGVDKNGEVNEVTGEAKDAVAISDVNLKEGVLAFRAKSDNDLLGYHMKLVGTDKAKLQIDDSPPNVKPFALERASEFK